MILSSFPCGRKRPVRLRTGCEISPAAILVLRKGGRASTPVSYTHLDVYKRQGWGIFIFAIAPHHFRFKGLGLGVGVALTAWTLGARHAFDADHISAIDNTTRKLMSDGRRPLGTGFFFALGHSSIIMVVGVGLSMAARAVFGAVVTPESLSLIHI